MKFNFCLGNLMSSKDDWGLNHAATVTAGDIVLPLKLALEQAGHSVMANRTYLAKDAINIFIGGFHRDKRGLARELKSRGYRFGLIALEWLKDGYFNPFEESLETSRFLYEEF